MSRSSNDMLYTLPGFPKGLPEKDILVEHGKEYFLRAREAQGMVGLSWEGEDKEGGKVLYHDVFITYNKDDKRAQSDKDGKEFKPDEIVTSDQPLGKNTGIVHAKAMDQLRARIANAIHENDSLSLMMYKELYTVNENEITLNRKKMFGWGIFKGDDELLLYQIRNSSANINTRSVCFNPGYLYSNFFDLCQPQPVRDDSTRDYHLRRSLPLDVIKKIHHMLLDQLPSDAMNIKKVCYTDMEDYYNYPFEKEWEKIKKNPAIKIEKLIETLKKFSLVSEAEYKNICGLFPSNDHLKNIVRLIKNNFDKLVFSEISFEKLFDVIIKKGHEKRVRNIKNLIENEKTKPSVFSKRSIFFKDKITDLSARVHCLLDGFQKIKDISEIGIQKEKMMIYVDTFILRKINILEYTDFFYKKNGREKNISLLEHFIAILKEENIFNQEVTRKMFEGQKDFINYTINALEGHAKEYSMINAFSV